jgi:hypothetical protein
MSDMVCADARSSSAAEGAGGAAMRALVLFSSRFVYRCSRGRARARRTSEHYGRWMWVDVGGGVGGWVWLDVVDDVVVEERKRKLLGGGGGERSVQLRCVAGARAEERGFAELDVDVWWVGATTTVMANGDYG